MLTKPRFERAANISLIQLTERDVKIMRHVHRHRFLRSTHIQQLVEGGTQAVLHRLQLLFHHGYLDRPRSQIEYYRGGSQPMVYGLGNKGAQVLEQQFGIPQQKVDWTTKNRVGERMFLHHTLSIADVMVTLEQHCHRRANTRLVSSDEMPMTKQDDKSSSIRWDVTVGHDGKAESLGVIPDSVFAIHFEDRPHKSVLVFLEADRATMPVVRHGLKQTSFFRKMLAYQETWRQKLHTSLFGYARCIVLTVTTTAERVENLVNASQKLNNGRGSGLFWFVDRTALANTGDIFTLPLRSGRGEIVTLAE